MKLYEINAEIQNLMDQIVIDEETGEVCCDVESILHEVDSLQMERRSILEYLAKLVLNLRAEGSAVKAEEIRLRKRRMQMESKEENILRILDRECAGEKTDLGVATFQYRKTSRLDVLDWRVAFDWLKEHGKEQCYRIPEPEIARTEVKKLIASGTAVPGCEVIEDRSYSLR